MNPSIQRLRSGTPGLDEILCGGLIPHRLYLVDGNPGAGKTTLALQFLLEGARNGEKCLYVTLSETREELEAGAQSHGWFLQGIEIVELVPQEDELQRDEQLTMLPPSEIELDETIEKLLKAVERHGPSRVIIDSLSELRLLAQSALRYRRQILALKTFFIGRGCTVIMLDDRTSEVADLQLHSLAHGVISLERKAPVYGQVRRELHVPKYRGSDIVTGLQDFTIRSGGLTVYPRLAATQAISFQRGLIASGVTALDTLVGGGIERGTSTLLVGPPGCGKSTLALQFAVAAIERGDHAATFVFDETKFALLERSAGLGMRIKEGVGAGEIAINPIDPVAVAPGEFANRVCRCVERDHARVVIIDSLNGYLNAMPQDTHLTAQLHELLFYLHNHGVTTFITLAQTGTIGANVTSPVDASYLADSVLLLRYFEYGGRLRKAISVLKKRTGAHEGSIRELWFEKDGIHLGEPLLKLRGVLMGAPIELTGPGEHDGPRRA